jgi:hypothetical protein
MRSGPNDYANGIGSDGGDRRAFSCAKSASPAPNCRRLYEASISQTVASEILQSFLCMSLIVNAKPDAIRRPLAGS